MRPIVRWRHGRVRVPGHQRPMACKRPAAHPLFWEHLQRQFWHMYRSVGR